jgi:hypothetical protein
MATSTSRHSLRGGRVGIKATSLIVATAAFLVPGLVGAYRYAHSYWLYRGFAPPTLRQAAREVIGQAWVPPSGPIRDGVVQKISVWSPAIERRQPVWVFLPPGYSEHPDARYPVIYLLHGFPGGPLSFFSVARAGLVQDILVAAHRMEPMIEVVPEGSPGLLQDDEWANSVSHASGWETFLARDVVNAIDTRYRTIPTGCSPTPFPSARDPSVPRGVAGRVPGMARVAAFVAVIGGAALLARSDRDRQLVRPVPSTLQPDRNNGSGGADGASSPWRGRSEGQRAVPGDGELRAVGQRRRAGVRPDRR